MFCKDRAYEIVANREFNYAFVRQDGTYYCILCLDTEVANLQSKEAILKHLREKHGIGKLKFEAVMHPDVYKETLQAFGEVIDLLAVAGTKTEVLEPFRQRFEQFIWNVTIRKVN